MTATNRIPTLLALVTAVLLSIPVSPAAAYPDRPIKMLVGAGAGGGTDATARVIGKFMEKSLGQPIIVVNRPGAGGSVMASELKNAKPDGYMIGLNPTVAYTFNPIYSKAATYAVEDFAHIAIISRPQAGLDTLTGKPWHDWKSFIAYFKSAGRPIAYASQNPVARLLAQAISNNHNVKFEIIPTKGGADSIAKLLGGHVDLIWSGGGHINYVKEGKLLAVAATGATRMTALPMVPTLDELGEDIEGDFAWSLAGPKGLPSDVAAKLAEAVAKAVEEPEVKTLLAEKQNLIMDYRAPAAALKYMLDERAAYRKLIKKAAAK
jgi:putative tricarboxylic transport membrane protein